MVGRPESRDVERWGLVIGDRKRGDGGHRRFKGHEILTRIVRTAKPTGARAATVARRVEAVEKVCNEGDPRGVGRGQHAASAERDERGPAVARWEKAGLGGGQRAPG